MNIKLKFIIFIIVAGGILAFSISIYMFNKPHRDISSEKAEFNLLASDLVEEYISNEGEANNKYLDKVLSVEGTISDIENLNDKSIVFYFIDNYEGLSASFDSVYVVNNPKFFSSIAVGESVKFKGKCDGFLMLRGVVLNKCVLE